MLLTFKTMADEDYPLALTIAEGIETYDALILNEDVNQ